MYKIMTIVGVSKIELQAHVAGNCPSLGVREGPSEEIISAMA